ncbi:hypothetical protein [Nocardiopsis coralliicola]
MQTSEHDVEHLAAVLQRRAEELDGRHATVGGGDIVHAVTTDRWIGVRVPTVLCRATADPLRLRPTDAPVTCRTCTRRLTGHTTGLSEGQLSLDT